jgi:NAD(P)-dependent dehydrogenase (short-subunit alcohol dehydrogenase family)
MQLEGRCALVTGAGSGIGRAAALCLAREGARVALVGRDEEELEDTLRAIRSAGGEGFPVVADIRDLGAMEAGMEAIRERWGGLDVVFANAGVNGVWAPLEELSLNDWKESIDINLTGTFVTLKSAYPLMKGRRGSIVVTSSVNGTRMFSNTGATAYACAKAGQVALTKMLAVELAQEGIRINVICPGAIETEIDENTEERDLEQVRMPVEFPEGKIPLGGEPGESEQVARLVLFLASEASSHITGTEVWIDGGQSLLQG